MFHHNLETKLIYDYNNILRQEEDFWKLKYRVQWLNEGDDNTKFFHTTTVHRRHKNRILGLIDIIGNWSLDQEVITSTIINHFKDAYSTELAFSVKELIPRDLNFLTHEDQLILIRPLSTSKIQRAIKSFKPLKAPGPNDLHPLFFQQFWDDTSYVVTKTCMNAFSCSHISPLPPKLTLLISPLSLKLTNLK